MIDLTSLAICHTSVPMGRLLDFFEGAPNLLDVTVYNDNLNPSDEHERLRAGIPTTSEDIVYPRAGWDFPTPRTSSDLGWCNSGDVSEHPQNRGTSFR